MSYMNPHRGLGPAPGNTRLNELLEGIRAEFESQARASGEYEHSSTLPVWVRCSRSVTNIYNNH